MTLSPIEAVAVFVAGITAGLLFFGGLKWTIQKLPLTRHPFALALASLFIRAAFIMGVLLFVGQREWQRYVVLLAGILLARLVAVRVWGGTNVAKTQSSHAEGE